MRRIVVVLGVVISFNEMAHTQSSPGSQRSVVVRVDSTRQHMNSSDTVQQQTLEKENLKATEPAKIMFDGEHVLDVKTLPFAIGQRESVTVSLGAFDKAHSSFAEKRRNFNGRISVGYGSYVSPQFDGWIGVHSATADMLFQANLKSSEGRFANQDYRKGDASVLGGVHLPDAAGIFSKGRLLSELTYRVERYKLYGSVAPNRVRRVDQYDASVYVRTSYERGGFLNLGVQFDRTTMTDSVRTDENRAGIEIAGGLMIDRTKLTGEVKFSKNFYSSALRTRDPYLGCGSVLVQYWFSDRFDIELGMTGFYGRGTGSSLRKALHPIAGIRWHAIPTMTAFAKYEPYVQQSTLALLLERNPYLMYTTPLMNTEFFQHYSAGMEFVGEIVKVKGAVSYKRAYFYPIFLDTVEKLWSVSYEGSTKILSIESTLYANISAEDNLGVSFAFEKAKKESPGLQAGFESELPYHPRVLVGAIYQHRFPVGFAVESSVKFVGRRFADFLNTRMLRPVTFWDVKAEYRIKQQLSIGVTVENILEQQGGYWEGYVTQSRRAALLIAFSW